MVFPIEKGVLEIEVLRGSVTEGKLSKLVSNLSVNEVQVILIWYLVDTTKVLIKCKRIDEPKNNYKIEKQYEVLFFKVI